MIENAAAAMENPKTAETNQRMPRFISKNISDTAARTNAITAKLVATGPCKLSAIRSNGSSHGKPLPLIAAKAFFDSTVKNNVKSDIFLIFFTSLYFVFIDPTFFN